MNHWRDRDDAAATHIHRLVRKWAELTPLAPALSDASRTLTYSGLLAAVERAGRLLASTQVIAGDRVMIVGENSVAAVVFLLAAQALDAWPAMVNARMSRDEVTRLRVLTQPRITLFATEGSSAARGHADGICSTAIFDPLFGEAQLGESDPLAVAQSVCVEPERRVGMLIFTSGTTGFPKAVMLSHAGLLALGRILARSRLLSRGDTYNGAAPLSHIMGIANLMCVLAAGGSLRLMQRFEPGEIAQGIATGQLTHLSFVPAAYARLVGHVEAEGVDVSRHRLAYISCGGAPLDPLLKQRVESLFGLPLVNGYGMTECAPATRTRADRYSPAQSIGNPEEGVEAKIVDQAGRSLADDTVGELWLRSPSSMIGYFGNPEETASTLRPDGWIATGDLARWLASGEIALVGRRKEMIIRSGFNVYPAEVEIELNRLAAVAQSAVVGRPVADGNEEVIAFVELGAGQRAGATEILDALRERIAPYKRPACVYVVGELPVGPTGKILKARLAEMARSIDAQENLR